MIDGPCKKKLARTNGEKTDEKKIFDRVKKVDVSSLRFGHGMARISSPLRGGHGNHIVTAGNVSSRAWRIAETRSGSSPVLNYVVSRVLASCAYVV